MSDNITLPREVVERLVATWDWDAETLIGHRMKIMSELVDNLRTALAAEQPKPSEDIEALRLENERLREALTYDWDQLEACRESLREHMVEIKRLRELLTEAKDLAWAFGADSLRDRINAALRREGT